MILKSIISIIKAAAVTEKIYPVILPQKVELPACKVFIVGDKPNPGKQEISKLNFIDIQVSTFAKTYSAAATLDAAIKSELDNYHGTLNKNRIRIQHTNTHDLYEDETRVHHRATDYRIFKMEGVPTYNITFNITADGAVLPGATIIMLGYETKTTDANGQAIYRNLPAGDYDYMVVYNSGILEENTAIIIDANINVDISYTLPFTSDLLTLHGDITGNNLAENIVGLPGKILPRCADFNGDDYIDTGIQLSGSSFDITIECKKASSGIVAVGQGNSTIHNRTGILWVSTNILYVLIGSATSPNYGIYAVLPSTTKDIIRVVYDGSLIGNENRLKLYMNDVLTSFDSFTGVIPATISVPTNNFYIGQNIDGALYSISKKFKVKLDGVFEYYPTGQGDYEYDISGNNNHGTWFGPGARHDYDLEGSIQPNDIGYSLWQKTGSEDIQVLFDVNGNALSLTPGVNVPTGYTKTRDVAAGGSKHNMFDSLIDFDPTDTGDSKLDNLDRSNATICNDDARAGNDYDSTHPYQILVSNLINMIGAWKNTDHKNKEFIKVVTDEIDIIRLDEVPNYETKKVGNDLTRVLAYCNLTDIYP